LRLGTTGHSRIAQSGHPDAKIREECVQRAGIDHILEDDVRIIGISLFAQRFGDKENAYSLHFGGRNPTNSQPPFAQAKDVRHVTSQGMFLVDWVLGDDSLYSVFPAISILLQKLDECTVLLIFGTIPGTSHSKLGRLIIQTAPLPRGW